MGLSCRCKKQPRAYIFGGSASSRADEMSLPSTTSERRKKITKVNNEDACLVQLQQLLEHYAEILPKPKESSQTNPLNLEESEAARHPRILDSNVNMSNRSMPDALGTLWTIAPQEPQRIRPVLGMPPPRRFYRTVWRSFTRRILNAAVITDMLS